MAKNKNNVGLFLVTLLKDLEEKASRVSSAETDQAHDPVNIIDIIMN